jgi:lipoprotein NlpD
MISPSPAKRGRPLLRLRSLAAFVRRAHQVRGGGSSRSIVPLLALALILSACSSTPPAKPGGTYVVRSGDTLYSIASRHGLDFREVARWNGIGRDYRIYPGQVLRLGPGGRATAAAPTRSSASTTTRVVPPQAPIPAIPWQWPVDGGVAKLTERPNGGHGLMISGKLGQDIRAASGGRVVYLGSGLLGYGQLLIIKHSDAYLSAYGHTQTVSVKEGDAVAIGQRIATMGTDAQGTPMLYFEIRSNGTPGNPLLLLPKRTSLP